MSETYSSHDPAPKRRSKLWSIAFIVSLAFNLFIGGLMIGHAIYGRSDISIARSSPYNVLWASRVAGPEARQHVRDLWEANQSEIRANISALRQSQRAVIEGLVATDLNEASLQSLLRELRERTMSSQAMMHRDFVTLLGNLTPAQRAEIAQAARRAASRESRRRMDRPAEPQPTP